eukprot:909687-Karenia_brevis.AAC.1
MIQESAYEFQIPPWTATLDFKKAFDTVSHAALWSALSSQGIPKSYIRVLAKLYGNQTGQVETDVASRKLPIQRGTKQGDPLS